LTKSFLLDPLVQALENRLGSRTALMRVGDARHRVGRGAVSVVEQSDETDTDERTVAVDSQCFVPPPARVRLMWSSA
jgi:hypothetical protein